MNEPQNTPQQGTAWFVPYPVAPIASQPFAPFTPFNAPLDTFAQERSIILLSVIAAVLMLIYFRLRNAPN